MIFYLTFQTIFGVRECFPPCSILKIRQTQSEKFKIMKIGAALTYDKCSELLSLAETNHKKIKQDANFSNKYQKNVYDIQKLPNYENKSSFNIDSYVYIIQTYISQKLSIYLRMPK